MSPSEQRRAVRRSRKAFAFLSDTGNAGTEKVYIDCPRKIQTDKLPERILVALVLYKFAGLR